MNTETTSLEEKEIADQIFENMRSRITPHEFETDHNKDAKDCAIVACDWVISELDEISKGESGTTKIDYGQSKWERIKQHIKLKS